LESQGQWAQEQGLEGELEGEYLLEVAIARLEEVSLGEEREMVH